MSTGSVDQKQSDPTTAVGAVFRWVSGQPFNNVVTTAMLFTILAGLYGLYTFAQDALKVHIPSHLKSIQDGYDRISTSHSSEIKEIVDAFKVERETDRRHHKEIIDLLVNGKATGTTQAQAPQ